MAALAGALAIAGCGGGGGAKTSTGAPIRTLSVSSATKVPGSTAIATTPEIRALVSAWASAGTPQAVCSLMSYGFRLGVGRGQAPTTCTAWIAKTFGPFTVSSGRVLSSSTIAGQIRVLADLGGHPGTLYLVRECGGLKINSIGTFVQHLPARSCTF